MADIPIFRLEFEETFVKKFERGVRDILHSDAMSEGRYVRKFEEKFKAFVHADYAVAVSSGTAALEIALRALDVRKKTVLMPTNTFFATSIAAVNAGADFRLLDIEGESLSIDPGALESALQKSRKGEIGAVIIVHVGGIISAHMPEIIRICKRYGAPLIEDAAHAHGSMRHGLSAGTIGALGCFSFFPTKVMTTGEGGMVTTNDPALFEESVSLKDFGRPARNAYTFVREQGANAKVPEMIGLFGVLECERVRRRIARRNTLVRRYAKNLKSSGYVPVLQSDGACSYYKCILRLPRGIDPGKLKRFCKERGVSLTGEVYSVPLHEQPLYQKKFADFSFPHADLFCAHHICPPLYPELSNDEVDTVCQVLLQAEQL